ncbi:hypothetical protein [Sporosarcina sp. ITBMC105]
MSNIDLITFERMDYTISSHVVESAKEFADLFKNRKPYVTQYCSLIKTSKRWDMQNINDQLDRWVNRIERISGTTKLVAIVKKAFEGCESNEEISDLRGAMVEALVIGCFGGSSNIGKKNYGWGARVDINLPSAKVEEVIYRCTNATNENCANRSTVDFGYWNGYHGEFYECKVQPASIGCKEIKYMEYLKSKLNTRGISHEVFFVCPEHSDEIKIKLDSFDLGPLFKPIGIHELTNMMNAG